ncbi:MAG: universal stress protein [Nostocoides sp.]
MLEALPGGRSTVRAERPGCLAPSGRTVVVRPHCGGQLGTVVIRVCAENESLGLVVAGADGSWQSLRAVEAATREAARRGLTLMLLTVAGASRTTYGRESLGRLEDTTPASARAASARAVMAARATDPDVSVEVAVVTSPWEPELDRIIERTHLLVLGDHGRGGQVAFSIGSTSGDLARCFRRPILLPGVDTRPRELSSARHPEVFVGLSGQGDETDLLRVAATEALVRGSSLGVIRAVPAAHPGERVLLALVRAWQVVRSVPETAAVACHVDVAQDDPVTALLARCEPDDLLVVGTRGGGTLAGLVTGSVARGVLNGLPCDVVVVPRGARVAPVATGRVPEPVLQSTEG